MHRLNASLILSISLGIPLTPAHAIKHADTKISTPDVQIQSRELTPAKESALDTLQKMYDARDKLTTFHVEYHSITDGDDHGGHQYPYTLTVSGDLQKPNKFNIRISHGPQILGQVISDGVTTTYYNHKTNEYAQFATPSNYDVKDILTKVTEEKLKGLAGETKSNDADLTQEEKQDKAEVDAQSVLEQPKIGTMSAIASAVEGSKFLLRKTTPNEIAAFLPLIGDVKHSKTQTPGSNHPVETVDMSEKVTTTSIVQGHKEIDWSIGQMHLAFNAISGLPQEVRLISLVSYAGRKTSVTMFNYVYDSITPAAEPYPVDTFTWTAHARAKLYRKPKDTDTIVLP